MSSRSEYRRLSRQVPWRVWTTDLPTKPGEYRMKCKHWYAVVEVAEQDGQLVYFHPRHGGSGHGPGDPVSEPPKGTMWAGPIPEALENPLFSKRT